MNASEVHARIALIRDAFLYAQWFRERRFVIYIDDRLLEHAQIPNLINDIAMLRTIGIEIVLVVEAAFHIEALLTRTRQDTFAKKNNTERHSANRAIVDEADIAAIEQASYACAGRVMNMLATADAEGIIGDWAVASEIGVRDGVDWGRRGLVEEVDSHKLKSILRREAIPILTCINRSRGGKIYEVSARTLALRAAASMDNMQKLFFVCAEPEIGPDDYALPDDLLLNDSGRVSQLTLGQVEQLYPRLPGINLNGYGYTPPSTERLLARPAMLDDLLQHSYWAVKDSAAYRAHIVDGRRAGALLGEIFSTGGVGTLISGERIEFIRAMSTSDIPEVLRLMRPWVEDGILIGRTGDDLSARLQDFVVYSIDETIHGCGALRTIDGQVGLIEAIAVDREQERLGIGGDIVRHLLAGARTQSLQQLYALTTRTADWFERFGFYRVTPDDLPPKLAHTYNSTRRPRVLRLDLIG